MKLNNLAKSSRLMGGGIWGVLTLEILLEMETQLKLQLHKDDNFRLSDYFDYIGGTSTGAIIAAGLSLRSMLYYVTLILCKQYLYLPALKR